MQCEDKLSLMVDPSRFEQIIINLLHNALAYSAAGDTTIVHVKQFNETLLITIEDTGKGIPKKDLPFIFDRFTG